MLCSLILLAEAASQVQKKWVNVIIIILLFLVLIVGFITDLFQKKAADQAKEIDAMYVSDYCREGLLRTPKDVIKYVRKRELRNFYLKSRIILRIFLIYSLLYVLLMNQAFNNNYAESSLIISDMFFKFDWHLVPFYKIFKIPTDFPTVIASPIPHLTFQGYLTYIYFFLTVITIIYLLINGIFLTEKFTRAKKISIDVFGKTINTNSAEK